MKSFTLGGFDWIALKEIGDKTLIISNEVLFNGYFDSRSNEYEKSKLNAFLNEKFIGIIKENDFDVQYIVNGIWPLTIGQYNIYIKDKLENTSAPWFLRSPGKDGYVLAVGADGETFEAKITESCGLRPAMMVDTAYIDSFIEEAACEDSPVTEDDIEQSVMELVNSGAVKEISRQLEVVKQSQNEIEQGTNTAKQPDVFIVDEIDEKTDGRSGSQSASSVINNESPSTTPAGEITSYVSENDENAKREIIPEKQANTSEHTEFATEELRSFNIANAQRLYEYVKDKKASGEPSVPSDDAVVESSPTDIAAPANKETIENKDELPLDNPADVEQLHVDNENPVADKPDNTAVLNDEPHAISDVVNSETYLDSETLSEKKDDIIKTPDEPVESSDAQFSPEHHSDVSPPETVEPADEKMPHKKKINTEKTLHEPIPRVAAPERDSVVSPIPTDKAKGKNDESFPNVQSSITAQPVIEESSITLDEPQNVLPEENENPKENKLLKKDHSLEIIDKISQTIAQEALPTPQVQKSYPEFNVPDFSSTKNDDVKIDENKTIPNTESILQSPAPTAPNVEDKKDDDHTFESFVPCVAEKPIKKHNNSTYQENNKKIRKSSSSIFAKLGKKDPFADDEPVSKPPSSQMNQIVDFYSQQQPPVKEHGSSRINTSLRESELESLLADALEENEVLKEAIKRNNRLIVQLKTTLMEERTKYEELTKELNKLIKMKNQDFKNREREYQETINKYKELLAECAEELKKK